ncbi:MAG: hypothetical protein QME73_14125 [Bacillota bacterium]|nr:hypothetical protein [Bacillota bacterium]NPV44836.1 hypothetical protein [Bacillota bacterium]
MDGTLKTMQMTVLFFVMMILVFDTGRAVYTKQDIRKALEFATKAAAMEYKKDEVMAEGRGEIDEYRSREVYVDMMMRQYNLNEDEVEAATLYAGAINEVPYVFEHPVNGRGYLIERPMFVAVIRVRNKGVFIRNSIVVDNLSGTRLTVRRR